MTRLQYSEANPAYVRGFWLYAEKPHVVWISDEKFDYTKGKNLILDGERWTFEAIWNGLKGRISSEELESVDLSYVQLLMHARAPFKRRFLRWLYEHDPGMIRSDRRIAIVEASVMRSLRTPEGVCPFNLRPELNLRLTSHLITRGKVLFANETFFDLSLNPILPTSDDWYQFITNPPHSGIHSFGSLHNLSDYFTELERCKYISKKSIIIADNVVHIMSSPKSSKGRVFAVGDLAWKLLPDVISCADFYLFEINTARVEEMTVDEIVAAPEMMEFYSSSSHVNVPFTMFPGGIRVDDIFVQTDSSVRFEIARSSYSFAMLSAAIVILQRLISVSFIIPSVRCPLSMAGNRRCPSDTSLTLSSFLSASVGHTVIPYLRWADGVVDLQHDSHSENFGAIHGNWVVNGVVPPCFPTSLEGEVVRKHMGGRILSYATGGFSHVNYPLSGRFRYGSNLRKDAIPQGMVFAPMYTTAPVFLRAQRDGRGLTDGGADALVDVLEVDLVPVVIDPLLEVAELGAAPIRITCEYLGISTRVVEYHKEDDVRMYFDGGDQVSPSEPIDTLGHMHRAIEWVKLKNWLNDDVDYQKFSLYVRRAANRDVSGHVLMAFWLTVRYGTNHLYESIADVIHYLRGGVVLARDGIYSHVHTQEEVNRTLRACIRMMHLMPEVTLYDAFTSIPLLMLPQKIAFINVYDPDRGGINHMSLRASSMTGVIRLRNA